MSLEHFFIYHAFGHPFFFLFITCITTLILVRMSTLIITLNSNKKRRFNAKTFWGHIVVAMLSIIAVASTIFFFMSVITRIDRVSFKESTATEEILTHDLCFISNDASLRGEVTTFIGTGHFVVDTSTNYRYYYIEDGKLKQANVPTKNTYIEYIRDGSIPRIIGYEEKFIKKQMYGDDVLSERYLDKTNTYYIIYVPEGSIAKSFDLS